jgi:hypothetical protein
LFARRKARHVSQSVHDRQCAQDADAAVRAQKLDLAVTRCLLLEPSFLQ